jgi:hypothetical protein
MKPFEKLVVELEARWGEESTDKAPSAPNGESLISGRSLWAYPFFSGTREGSRVAVTISEQPVGQGNLLDAADNCEFLQISLFRKIGVCLILRHEGIFDRLKKKIRFDWEYQTGNAEFDRKYYIAEARSERDRKLVDKGDFQKLVNKLEPFASLALLDSGVHCSLFIEDESILSFECIDSYLRQLQLIIELADRS